VEDGLQNLLLTGTGGTIAGVSRFLKERNPAIKVFLIDPPGSALFNKVNSGVLFSLQDQEGKRKKVCSALLPTQLYYLFPSLKEVTTLQFRIKWILSRKG